MTPKRLLIFGAGGFGREIAWLVDDIDHEGAKWQVLGYIDDDPKLAGTQIGGLPVFGAIDEGIAAAGSGPEPVFVSIGVGSPAARRLIAQRLAANGRLQAATLVHPSAVIGPNVVLAAGSVVTAGVIIGPHAQIGEHVALNVSCGVGHDARVGDFSVVCPGARVSGGCVLGDGVFVGSNSVIAPGRRAGNGAVVGALSFVVLNVPAGRTALGNPARVAGGGRSQK